MDGSRLGALPRASILTRPSSQSISDYTQLLVRAPPGRRFSLLYAISIAVGACAAFTLGRYTPSLRRWVARILKRMKDD